MNIVYRRGEATAAEVREDLAEAPSYSAVRALLRILEEKEQLQHRRDGQRYVYRATRAREDAGSSALRRTVRTFFDGSATRAVAALLDLESEHLGEEELDRLERLIDDARRQGR